MSKQQVKVGDTIVIMPTSPIGLKYGGEKFVVKKYFHGGRVIVVNRDGTEILFDKRSYSIVSKQERSFNQECPECKGEGKILLFNFDSPCNLCTSAEK